VSLPCLPIMLPRCVGRPPMDRHEVLEAVRRDGKNGSALEYADDSLKADREVVLEAVRQSGRALDHAADVLKEDRELVMEAVRQDGKALRFAADPLKADRELVLEAVRQDGLALHHAAYPLTEDRELVLEAVRQNGKALEWAAEPLRADPLLSPEAICVNPFAVQGSKSLVCSVFELSAVESKFKFRVALGLGGKELEGDLPHGSTLGDLGRYIIASALDQKQYCYLILPGRETPVSALDVEEPLADLTSAHVHMPI